MDQTQNPLNKIDSNSQDLKIKDNNQVSLNKIKDKIYEAEGLLELLCLRQDKLPELGPMILARLADAQADFQAYCSRPTEPDRPDQPEESDEPAESGQPDQSDLSPESAPSDNSDYPDNSNYSDNVSYKHLTQQTTTRVYISVVAV
ncbi:MAG: hypothetical protein K2G67_00200, partial [Muribaculaceae bacterium]|nr:hypothetical protein [Muribaculaceae bacterium]